MSKIFVGCAAALAVAGAAVSAQAATFAYSFTSNDLSEAATGLLFATSNGDGTFTANSGTINLSGSFSDTGGGHLVADAAAPATMTSPSGFFYFDNQLLPGQNPLVLNGGLLFVLSSAAHHEVNIFSNGPSPVANAGTYTLMANTSETTNGAFSLTAVPEPASWALMLVGFGGLGAVLRRRRQLTAAVAA